MPRALPRQILGPKGRVLNVRRPLFVGRRLSVGSDPDTGEQKFLEPGTPFDPSTVSAMRLRTLFSNRYLTHDEPGSGAQGPGQRTGVRARHGRDWDSWQPQLDENGVVTNGPTLEEFTAAGYPEERYPPVGYHPVASPALEALRARQAAQLGAEAPAPPPDRQAEAQEPPPLELPEIAPPAEVTAATDPAVTGDAGASTTVSMTVTPGEQVTIEPMSQSGDTAVASPPPAPAPEQRASKGSGGKGKRG